MPPTIGNVQGRTLFTHNINNVAVLAINNRTASTHVPPKSASLGGIRPWAEHAHYCASKAGVIMLTKALSKAFAPQITVNSVAPGVIPFNDVDARTQAMIDATPMQRAGKPEEIADAVYFFLTAPTFITGQIMAVDGGLNHR
jgi:3-oxoacyl-[acyl-carrier protein] reductase/pteridine reductase